MTNDTPAPAPRPTAFGAYGHGWRMLKEYFLELLLITAAYVALTLPTAGLWGDNAAEFLSEYVSFNLIIFKIGGAPGAALFSIAYALLLQAPLAYGIDYASLVAARSEVPNIGKLFSAFMNYWNAVLANLLVFAITGMGFVMLIIPGLYFMVKLSFVSFLVVERKMDAVAAVKESWRMTTGYGWRIFGILMLALPIGLAGLLFFGVGIIISIIWFNLAMATMYHAVAAAKAPSSEVPPM